jgi:hydroxymethylbilane synthase
VQRLLGGEAHGVHLQVIRTRGDQLLDVPLQNQLDKGFFTKELEVALDSRAIDLAVHSLKDLPTQMPPGLVLGAVPCRADAGDVLLIHPRAHAHGEQVPLRPGSRVGTASLRRSALLRHFAPLSEPAFLRGNVPTRLGKARSGELDAVVLARAGVSRLGLDLAGLVAYDLDPRCWLPAAAQGALGLQCRAGDAALLSRLAAIADAPTAEAVGLERSLLQRMEGGCHSPFGAWAEVSAGRATLRAGTVDDDGRWVRVCVEAALDEVVAAAEKALRAAIARGPVPAGEEAMWLRPVQPWS